MHLFVRVAEPERHFVWPRSSLALATVEYHIVIGLDLSNPIPHSRPDELAVTFYLEPCNPTQHPRYLLIYRRHSVCVSFDGQNQLSSPN